MNLKKIGKIFTSKFVGAGPSSYENRIYSAAVSQRLGNTGLNYIEVDYKTDLHQKVKKKDTDRKVMK